MEKSLREALQAGPILADGAMGSQIYERGVFLTACFEEANLSKPDLIRKIHEDYVVAGANLLGTNTYGANRFRLGEHGKREQLVEIIQAGVRIAREAAAEQAYVGGCVGPTGKRVDELDAAAMAELREALDEQIGALIDAGVDAVLLETFNHMDEVLMAIDIARGRSPEIVVVAQMAFNTDRRTLEGLEPEEVAHRLAAAGADVVGVNCSDGPRLVFEVAERMLDAGVAVAAQPNAGHPEHIEGRVIYVANPEYFGVWARRLLKRGIRMVGGCCGTRPEFIGRMAQTVRMMGGRAGGTKRVEARIAPSQPASGRDPTPLSERSELGARLGQQFVVSVEVNPPVGFETEELHQVARDLRAAGVTVVNVADGPRASARMGNLSFASALQRAVGMETILHVCCRDRSLLGLLSHLLGAHYEGIRNLVVITGDPPKMGDYPNSSGVYDVDSVELLRIARNLNRGVDPAGKELPEPTSFLLATGAEPGALDYEREMMRLYDKRQAGAEVVMTQPVYDLPTLERFLDDTEGLGLPILLGLVPLASYRNAKFLSDNVPGMKVPDDIQERMKAAGKGASARAEGVRIAREMLEVARDRVQGVYIMPPLGRYEMAVEIIDGYVDAPVGHRAGD